MGVSSKLCEISLEHPQIKRLTRCGIYTRVGYCLAATHRLPFPDLRGGNSGWRSLGWGPWVDFRSYDGHRKRGQVITQRVLPRWTWVGFGVSVRVPFSNYQSPG